MRAVVLAEQRTEDVGFVIFRCRDEDIGVSDTFMKELAATLTPGSSALFVLVRKATPDKVLEGLKGFKGKIIQTSLTKNEEQSLRAFIEAESYDGPSLIIAYSHCIAHGYNLAKSYHKFYHDHSILNADSEAARDFRLALSVAVARVLKMGMELLGIEMPERM